MISIIIPTLKEEAFIGDTLENLRALGDYPHEIIVSDGGSKDRTLDIVREYTDKVVLWEGPGRQTFGNAKNAAAKIAQGDYLVFIDADVIIPHPKEFFVTMVERFENNPGLAGAIVPLRSTPHLRTFWDPVFTEPLNLWYLISNNFFDFGNASGEFQMIRRTAFIATGGYREDLPAGEDTDMFYRLAKSGRTRYYQDRFVYHSCRRAHKLGWLHMYFIWIRNGLSVLILKRAAYKEWKVIR